MTMSEFFPHGFWPMVVMIGMGIFTVFGVDLVFGAKLVKNVSRMVNKSFHVDQAVINLLEALKRNSDREYDMENTLLQGWGRFVAGGVLIGAAFLLFNLLPSLK